MAKIIYLTIFATLVALQMDARRMPISNGLVVQPANWWAGMKLDTISFLVHHPTGIKNLTAVSDGAKILATRSINKYYSIVEVKINSIGAITITGLDGKGLFFKKSIPILPNQNYYNPKGFDNADLVYLIMPDRFANGNLDNDNVSGMEQVHRSLPGGRHGGDLQGIIKHLDYIKQLGVTSIWLTPFQEMNDSSGSYHGYGMSNLYETDARYSDGIMGATERNNELFKIYSDAVHEKNMKVIMDVVPNHIGMAHPWNNAKTPLTEWIHDSSTLCHFEMTSLTDPYAIEEDLQAMEKGWFVKSMPDLNHQNKDLCKYLLQCHIWWIKMMHIDGLRIDTQPFNDRKFIADWSKSILLEFPTITIVGENWCVINSPIYPAYYQSSIKNYDNYNSNVSYVMDFPLFENIVTGLKNKDLKLIYRTIGQDFMYEDPSKKFIFLGNHDTERFYTSIKEDYKKYQMGIILNATLRGLPQLYYGDELLMTGVKGINDGIMRQDIKGQWPTDSSNFFDNPMNIPSYKFAAKIFNWRLNNEVLHQGDFKHKIPQKNVYAYARTYKNKAILIVLNANETDVPFLLSDYDGLVKKYENIKYENFLDTNNNGVIPAKGFIILSMKD